VEVRPLDSSIFAPLRIVPTYPDLPMESVFVRPGASHNPGVFVRQEGRGRVVYFPGDLDRTFWEVLNDDHAKLLRNAVIWATDEAAPLTVEGRGILDVSIWEQKSSMTVHLVNLTNPMMMKGAVREIIPIPSQKVTFQIPKGRRVKRVHLLVGSKEVHYETEGARISVEVPSIGLNEVIAVDFA
jgi:hypothetical protein